MKCRAFFLDMEARTFKTNNYIHVPGFAIVELQLSGNELLCYSLIYGFTQDEETEFNGSLSYVASALNVTKQNAKRIIDRLIEKGLVEKREMFFSGVKFCKYVANRCPAVETAMPLSKQQRPVAETATPPVTKSATNNNIIINNNRDNIAADGGLFPAEQVEQKQRGTTEGLCLFANSRYNSFDAFRACFDKPEYNEIDLYYYFCAVSDWSAQKGKKMRDWIATARNFMRGDKERGKLHLLRNEGGKGVLTPEEIEYLNAMSEGL